MVRPEDCISFITKSSSKAFVSSLEKRFKLIKVGITESLVLYFVMNNPGITQHQLSKIMDISEPSLGRLIARMVEEESLYREIYEDDLRIRKLNITDEGKKRHRKCQKIIREFHQEVTKGIDPNDLDTMKRTLDRMVQNTLNSK